MNVFAIFESFCDGYLGIFVTWLMFMFMGVLFSGKSESFTLIWWTITTVVALFVLVFFLMTGEKKAP